MNKKTPSPGVSRRARLSHEGLQRLEKQLAAGVKVTPPVLAQWIRRYGVPADSTAQFRWVKAPTNSELTQLTHTIAQRLARYLERQGLLERDAESSYLTQAWRDSVLPPAVTARVAVEQASTFGWERYVGSSGRIIGMQTFGASAPLRELQRKFGFEPDKVVAAAHETLGRKQA